MCIRDRGRDLVQVNQNLSSETKFPVCSVQTEKQQMALSFDTVWGEGNIQEILAVSDGTVALARGENPDGLRR